MVVNMLHVVKRQTDPDVRLLQAAADPTRLRLLSLVAAHEGGEACVCDLTAPVNLSQPTVSHHLKVLREAGWVRSERSGSWIYYHLLPEALERFARIGGSLTPGAGAARIPAARALPVIQPGA